MTFQGATDQIAKQHGYQSWGHVLYALYESDISPKHLQYLEDKAADLYARYKWDEACNEQRDRCVAQFINSVDVKVNQFSAREYCSIAPKPEFKP